MTADRSYAAAASSDASGYQPEEGGSQPTLPLHLPPPDFSRDRYTIRPLLKGTADAWYRAWHYLGDAPSIADHWGVFAPDLGAVVSIGLPNNPHGIASRLGLTDIPGNLEVSRVAVHPDFPAHTSRVLALVVRLASQIDGWSWCFSYADTGRGHHGGIYQALGAVYVGMTDERSGWADEAGTFLHPRTVVSLYGTQARAAMEARGFSRVAGTIAARHTYVLPVGPRAAEVRERCRPLAKPYPKRAAIAASTTTR